MKNPEKRRTEPKEISDVIKGIEKCYSSFVKNQGILGYCVGCDSLSYLIEPKSFNPKQINDLECFNCGAEESENLLLFASLEDMLELNKIFTRKLPEKIVYLIDTWRDKNNFLKEERHNYEQGKKLMKSFKEWDNLKNSEKYEQSINLLIEQERNLDKKRRDCLFRDKRQVFYNSVPLVNNGYNNK